MAEGVPIGIKQKKRKPKTPPKPVFKGRGELHPSGQNVVLNDEAHCDQHKLDNHFSGKEDASNISGWPYSAEDCNGSQGSEGFPEEQKDMNDNSVQDKPEADRLESATGSKYTKMADIAAEDGGYNANSDSPTDNCDGVTPEVAPRKKKSSAKPKPKPRMSILKKDVPGGGESSPKTPEITSSDPPEGVERSVSSDSQSSRRSLTRSGSYEAALDCSIEEVDEGEGEAGESDTEASNAVEDGKKCEDSPEKKRDDTGQFPVSDSRPYSRPAPAPPGPKKKVPPPRPAANPVGIILTNLPPKAKSPVVTTIQHAESGSRSASPPNVAPKPKKQLVEQVLAATSGLKSSTSTPDISKHPAREEKEIRKSPSSTLHKSSEDLTEKSACKAEHVKYMVQALSRLEPPTVDQTSSDRRLSDSQFYYDLDGSAAKTEKKVRRKSSSSSSGKKK